MAIKPAKNPNQLSLGPIDLPVAAPWVKKGVIFQEAKIAFEKRAREVRQANFFKKLHSPRFWENVATLYAAASPMTVDNGITLLWTGLKIYFQATNSNPIL